MKKKIVIIIFILIVTILMVGGFFLWKYFDINKITENINTQEYCDIKYYDNVYETSDWANISKDGMELTAIPGKKIPQKNEYIILQELHGVSSAYYIKAVTDNGDGTYTFEITDVDNPSDVMESISFAGKASFVTYFQEGSSNYMDNTLVAYAGEGIHEVKTRNSSNEEANTIEICFSYKETLDGKDKFSNKVKINGIDISDIQGDKNSEEQENKQDDDNSDEENEAECVISGTLKLEDLVASSNGKIDFWDMDNSKVNVSISANESFSLDYEGKLSRKIKLAEVEMPIPVTAGAVFITIEPYLEISAEGEAHFTYEIVGTKLEADIDFSKGEPDFSGCETGHPEQPSFIANAEMKDGIGVVAGLSILECSIVKPYISVDIKIKGEVNPVVRGWENIPQCIDISAGFPVVTVGVAFLEDSIVADCIERLSGWDMTFEKELLTLENAPIHISGHIETNENDGKLQLINRCTHIEREPIHEQGGKYYNNPVRPVIYVYDSHNFSEIENYYVYHGPLNEVEYILLDELDCINEGETVTSSKGNEYKKIGVRELQGGNGESGLLPYHVFELKNEEYCYSYNNKNGVGVITDDNGRVFQHKSADNVELYIRKDAKICSRQLNDESSYLLFDWMTNGKRTEWEENYLGAYVLEFDDKGYVVSIVFVAMWNDGRLEK